MQLTAPPKLRSDIAPGDIGGVAALHGREYAAEYGLDWRMEAYIARGLSRFALALAEDPDAGRLWLAEDDEGVCGSIAVTREAEERGRLRWFLVAGRARGRGIGRHLLHSALHYARPRFAYVDLETFSELTTAAAMYRAAGFELRDSAPQSDWGREIQLQHYELKLR